MKKCYLGVEFGSTRIKAVFIDEKGLVLGQGSHDWENEYRDGYFTYREEAIWAGLHDCATLALKDFREKQREEPSIQAMGLSGMMHGYLALDEKGTLLTPFHTWRTTNAGKTAKQLSNLLNCNIPMRWSVAQFHQAVLEGKTWTGRVRYLCTLSAYVHFKLSGQFVVGRGEASGIFPLADEGTDYDSEKLKKYDALLQKLGFSKKFKEILPVAKNAGEQAGKLEHPELLGNDPAFNKGIPLCPPEGDAGTGMVATNSVLPGTGNLSAGTSIFLMACLPHSLKQAHPEIDVVTTPEGKPVAMVHCNTGTSDFDAWVALFGEFARKSGLDLSKGDLYGLAYKEALSASSDAGGLLAYNCYSGEPVCGIKEGRPLFVRKPDSSFNLANFFRAHLNASLAGLCLGERILSQEGIALKQIVGQGGMFKNPEASHLFADALAVPIQTLSTAGEGGPYGMAVLAQYLLEGKGESLGDYLAHHFDFGGQLTLPDPEKVKGYQRYLATYEKGIAIEKEAAKALR